MTRASNSSDEVVMGGGRSSKLWLQSTFQMFFGLGCLHFKLYSKAKDAFTHSILVTPTAAAYCGLGICFLQRNEYESAIASFQAAVELDPHNDYDLNWLNWATHLHSHAIPEPGCRHCVQQPACFNGA